MSQDDKKFIEIVSNQVVQIDSHYSLPLPFRIDDVKMPNNREMAFQRAKGLVKRMKHDENYHREYTEFIEKLLQNDYAEKVPAEQLHVDKGKVWYIPHHVYHKRKKTLRVVFGCSSPFKNISLNGELLQGPDLTNNLLGVLTRFRSNVPPGESS